MKKRRLAAYYEILQEMMLSGRSRTNSGELAGLLGVSPSTVRKDLEEYDGCSRSGYGTDVRELYRAVSLELGLGRKHTAVSVGTNPVGAPVIRAMRGLGVEIAGSSPREGLEGLIDTVCPDILIITDTCDAETVAFAGETAVVKGVKGVINCSAHKTSFEGCASVDLSLCDAVMLLAQKIHKSES